MVLRGLIVLSLPTLWTSSGFSPLSDDSKPVLFASTAEWSPTLMEEESFLVMRISLCGPPWAGVLAAPRWFALVPGNAIRLSLERRVMAVRPPQHHQALHELAPPTKSEALAVVTFAVCTPIQWGGSACPFAPGQRVAGHHVSCNALKARCLEAEPVKTQTCLGETANDLLALYGALATAEAPDAD